MDINLLRVEKEIDNLVKTIIDKLYPVGSYYETDNIDFDPNASWYGTWIEDSKGLVLIGADIDGDTGLSKAGLPSVQVREQIGESEHKLTIEEMPSHTHRMPTTTENGAVGWAKNGNWNSSTGAMIDSTGGSQSHNNIQPSLGIRRWHRTA